MAPELETPSREVAPLNAAERLAVSGLVARLDAEFAGEAILGVPLGDVIALATTAGEKRLVARLLSLHPSDVGIATPATTDIGDTPETLVTVVGEVAVDDIMSQGATALERGAAPGVVSLVGQTYLSERQGRHLRMRAVRVSTAALPAFAALQQAITAELGRPLRVASQYRSRGHQLAVILRELAASDGDLAYVMSGVALPGYSEHQDLQQPAFDFAAEDGRVVDGFRHSDEYAWLQRNASRFGFELSYPDVNPWGIKPEPWHWRLVRP